MEHTTQSAPLTAIQRRVVDALGAGATLTAAAEMNGVHRVTVYRWMKTLPEFSSALQKARGEFVLGRRDDLHYLANRAIENILAIFDNPNTSPGVLLRASMFVLQRSNTGWCMPESAPLPEEELLDAAALQANADLPNDGLLPAGDEDIEDDEDDDEEDEDDDDSECNEMQPDSVTFTPHTLSTCPVPPTVLAARQQRARMRKVLDDLAVIEKEADIIDAMA